MKSNRAIVSAVAETSAQFFDVDPMNVVWHGNYPKFLELGRVAVLDVINYGYNAMSASGYSWPIVDMGIKYVQPVRLLQAIEIEAGVTEWENRLKIAFEIREKATGKRLTRAYSVQVAVDMASEQMQWETPPILREKLGRWL
ncbi:MAG: acyl-CoA thioesterase [Alphaproteobacteria bacterium]